VEPVKSFGSSPLFVLSNSGVLAEDKRRPAWRDERVWAALALLV
jgi:hypothetical protein